jgi:hypothetical protein
MDKRTIVARLAEIADQLDMSGHYEEADQLTAVASGLVENFRGAQGMGSTPNSRPINLPTATFERHRNLSSNPDFQAGMRALQEARLKKGTDQVDAVEAARRAVENLTRARNGLEPSGFGDQYGSFIARPQADKDQENKLSELILEASTIVRLTKEKPRDAAEWALRSQQKQLGKAPSDYQGDKKNYRMYVNDWVGNILRSAPAYSITTSQLIGQAGNVSSSFANDVQAFLKDKGFAKPGDKLPKILAR